MTCSTFASTAEFASLDEATFDRRWFTHVPALDTPKQGRSRRDFLKAASSSLLAFGAASPALASPLIFSAPEDSASVEGGTSPGQALESLALGEIPGDFWFRPRELWLRRHNTQEEVRAVYWKDGQIQPDGYWRLCALLRDRKANLMTAMDPAILDVLRGINGYYEAWRYPHPIVITSGYRTLRTNNSLEGAAKNSMHLHGRAIDLFVPGIPPQHIGALSAHLRQGGVGYYPQRGFTHVDTGRLRVWRG